jgi:hypothetical protein
LCHRVDHFTFLALTEEAVGPQLAVSDEVESGRRVRTAYQTAPLAPAPTTDDPHDCLAFSERDIQEPPTARTLRLKPVDRADVEVIGYGHG